MSLSIDIVATRIMDLYYQQYRDETSFFDEGDFIFHTGAAIGEVFRQEFALKYNELRQEKQDSVVTLSSDILVEDVLKVVRKDGEIYAEMEDDVFSFPFDQQNSAIQNVVPVMPRGACELLRSNMAVQWQNKHVPFTTKVFWWAEPRKIRFYSPANVTLAEVKVFYVPAISDRMKVPDAVAKLVRDDVIQSMRAAQQGAIVKTANDLNPNKIIQTEMNLNATK